MKIMRIKMFCGGKIACFWTVKRVESAINIVFMKKTRKVSGWDFTDNEGYTRFVEGGWKNLVEAFRICANNYGLECNIS